MESSELIGLLAVITIATITSAVAYFKGLSDGEEVEYSNSYKFKSKSELEDFIREVNFRTNATAEVILLDDEEVKLTPNLPKYFDGIVRIDSRSNYELEERLKKNQALLEASLVDKYDLKPKRGKK